MFGIFKFRKYIEDKVDRIQAIMNASNTEIAALQVNIKKLPLQYITHTAFAKEHVELKRILNQLVDGCDQRVQNLELSRDVMQDSLAKIEEMLNLNEKERYRIKMESEFRAARSQE